MPTLQFKGKNAIWNHHLSIPYHTLEENPKLDFQPEKGEGNVIIEGDNLLALKALLPQYAGKVKCIYIDPPYNTGNEGWVYNDNANSPLIKDWLGKEVGRDDLTRHDKWLCMMVPRLRLLRDLLSNDGIIFISIDDNEITSLRQILSELFGESNFLGQIIWKKKTNGNNMGFIPPVHDYITVYSKDPLKVQNFGYPINEKYLTNNFSNPDKDPRGNWTTMDLSANHKGPYFEIINPKTGDKHLPPDGRYWVFNEEEVKKRISEGRIIFGKTGNSRPTQKIFAIDKENRRIKVESWWDEHGLNEDGTEELKSIFGEAKVFNHPKPTKLLRHIINIATQKDKNSIILDSFAGSGTTMHAVMDLNKEDGGNRKCILVQMTETTDNEPKKNICKDITRERVKRAIGKFGYESGFKYLTVGKPIDSETMLSGTLPTYTEFAKYVYYLCTGEYHTDTVQIDEKSFFVGTFKRDAIYLVYKQDYDTLTKLALNLPLAEKMVKAHMNKKCIVYAPACFLDEDYLKEKNIEFVGIPYNLFTRNA